MFEQFRSERAAEADAFIAKLPTIPEDPARAVALLALAANACDSKEAAQVLTLILEAAGLWAQGYPDDVTIALIAGLKWLPVEPRLAALEYLRGVPPSALMVLPPVVKMPPRHLPAGLAAVAAAICFAVWLIYRTLV